MPPAPTAASDLAKFAEEKAQAQAQMDEDESERMDDNTYDAWLEEHQFDGRFNEDADMEKSLAAMKEKYTSLKKEAESIQVPSLGTADQKSALRDMLTKFGRTLPCFWEVLKEMAVDNPVKQAHGQLEKVSQCLQGVQ